MNLQLSRQQIMLYWAGTPNRHRQTNRLYRQMRIGAAQREISHANGERFLAPGYDCVSRADWLHHYSTTTPRFSPMRPIFGAKRTTGWGG